MLTLDLDCNNLPSNYTQLCLSYTATTGTCSPYRLAWRKLCYDTCTSLNGMTCNLSARDVCDYNPKCPSLCHSFFKSYCVVENTNVDNLNSALDSISSFFGN